jgi:hypothetical protein
MELTQEELDAIQTASRELDYGQITIKFAGKQGVDITQTKRIRYHNEMALPTQGAPQPARASGRYTR